MALATTITADHGVPFHVRVVFQGDGYGLWDETTRKHACTHNEPEPMVEFYDARYEHQPVDDTRKGQFVSRYNWLTLSSQDRERLTLKTTAALRTHLDSPEPRGLCLHGGIPAWTVDARSMSLVLAWAEGVIAGKGQP